jgi:hypothetical protein
MILRWIKLSIRFRWHSFCCTILCGIVDAIPSNKFGWRLISRAQNHQRKMRAIIDEKNDIIKLLVESKYVN